MRNSRKSLNASCGNAGDGVAYFTRFVFPSSQYRGRTFAAGCNFWNATFTHEVDFCWATFRQVVTHRVRCKGAEFTQVGDFPYATFTQNADLSGATFNQKAHFNGAIFTQEARFPQANFAQGAHFNFATFMQDVDFRGATFTQEARFLKSKFAGMVDFLGTHFAGPAQFEQTKFRQDAQDKNHQPGPFFSGADFEEPKKVTFYKTDLGQALFHNCDVSKVTFSDVTWRKRANGKWMVLDEIVDPQYQSQHYKFGPTVDLQPPKNNPNPRNYRLVAELYQHLKKNYDDRRDYWTAGDFHYGEMEMKRLASDRHNKALRWLHRNLGLVAWYKYASEYGESYVRPTWWLTLVLFVFMLLYPVAGLRLSAGRSGTPVTASANAEKLTYWHPLQDSGDTRPIWRARLALVGHSANTTVSISLFLRDMAYEPADPWGTAAKLAEMILTSTLGTLFLLAVRRQFKR